MTHVSVVLAGAILFGATAAGAQTPPTQPPQKPASEMQKPQPSKPAGQEVKLTGCLRQTSDDPKVFALVDAKAAQQSGHQGKPGEQKPGEQKPGQQTTAMGSAMHAPFYRLEDPGTPSLKPHVDKRVEMTGTVTPAKDEKGADIVTITKEQTIAMTTTTIRSIDLKPAPTLNVKSVRATGDCPAAKPKA